MYVPIFVLKNIHFLITNFVINHIYINIVHIKMMNVICAERTEIIHYFRYPVMKVYKIRNLPSVNMAPGVSDYLCSRAYDIWSAVFPKISPHVTQQTLS